MKYLIERLQPFQQYVLCAAHCFGQTKNPRSYTVRVGEWYLQQQDGTEKDHAVSEVHVHESYNRPKQFNNDIALMKLAQPVDFSGPYAGEWKSEIREGRGERGLWTS